MIVGGGIAGASIAYHLARRGWRDVAVVDQGELAGGTTAHAPGLVGQLRSSAGLTAMLRYSVSLYRRLAVDGVPGYHEVGSLRLASSRPRAEELQRQAEFARDVGLEARLIEPRAAARLFPLMSLDGVEAALHLPHDGSATAPVLARAMIGQALAQGVSVYPRTRVQAIEVAGGRVRAITTSAGRIETETLMVAAGIWSPRVGHMAGVALPALPVQHQYVVTGPLAELAGRTVPNLRDPDHLIYLRQDGERLVLGGYERDPRLFPVAAIPDHPDPTVRPFDPAHFEPLLRAAARRVPSLAAVELSRRVNGLEAFTPDGEFLLGPSAEVQGFWAACGFCAHGVSGAGGVGKVLADWIVDGAPSLDLGPMDLRRATALIADPRPIEQRVRAVYSTYYDIRSAAPGGS